MESTIPHIREILIFLAAAGILVPLFQRFKISPVLGFLIAGLILGPHSMGRIADIWAPAGAIVITGSEGVHALAELGITFLLFMIGLELSFERLSTMRRFVFGMGSLQVLVTAIVIGLIARIFGNGPEACILLGLGFALSSTAIVMQLLTEQRRMGSTLGRKSFAILLFQDLSVVLLLFILGFIGHDFAGGISAAALAAYLAKSLGFAALTIAAIIVIGRLALRPLFHMVSHSKNRELFMAATLLAVFSIAAGTEYAGLSTALGAFLAGLLLAETEYRHDIEITIEPFKGLLLGLFFMSVGMDVDLQYVLQNPVLIPASVIGLYIIKGAILYPIARLFGLTPGRAAELALMLGQAGEFVFVVLALTTDMNMISRETTQFMLIVTAISMMITPLVAMLGPRLRRKLDGVDAPQDAVRFIDSIDGHVVLAGYGRMGRLLRDVLAKQFIPVVAIDTVADYTHDSKTPVLAGDATKSETLIQAGLDRAIAVAVLIDKADDAKTIVETVRKLKPNMLIVARARDNEHAAALYKLGATVTIPDVIEGSLHVAQELLTHLGVSETAARLVIDQQRLHEAHIVETAKTA